MSVRTKAAGVSQEQKWIFQQKLPDEEPVFADLYRQIAREATTRVIEVGVWLGHSIRCLAQELGKLGKDRVQVIAVDHWNGSQISIHREFREIQDPFEAFKHNMRAAGLEDRITILRQPSTMAAPQFADFSADAVFIDAEHTYDDVTRDIQSWYSKVKSGGILAGDDFQIPDVFHAVLDLFADLLDTHSLWTVNRAWAIRKPEEPHALR